MGLLPLLEMFVACDMLRGPHQNKSDVLSAIPAGWKVIAKDAGNLVWLRMLIIVNCSINPRTMHFVPWLENLKYLLHWLHLRVFQGQAILEHVGASLA